MTPESIDQVAVLAHFALLLLEANDVTLERPAPTSDYWCIRRRFTNGETYERSVRMDPRKDPEDRARALVDALRSLGRLSSEIERETRREWERAEQELRVLRTEVAELDEQLTKLRATSRATP